MNNEHKTIEQILTTERDTITVPSRSEFRSMLGRVTNPARVRSTVQKGIVSPFGMFIRMTKNQLVIAGSIALLAIVIIIPTVTRRPIENLMVPQTDNLATQSITADTGSAMIAQTAQGTVTQDIITDILKDFSEEDAITQQELIFDDAGVNEDYSLDSALIS